MRLAIDAGHGLYTKGKRLPKALDPQQTREWTLNNRIVVKIIAILRDYEGIQILRLDDPTGKIDVPLPERTTLANNFKADLLMSVHANAFKGVPWDGGGSVVYAYPTTSANTKRMQKALYDEMIKETGLKGNRATGVPTANFHMLRVSKMAALLSENGFMDSRTDAKIILTEDFANKSARAHANFIIKEYKLKKKAGTAPTPKPPTPSNQLTRVQVGAYRERANADRMEQRLKKDGFSTYMIKTTNGLYRVQTGAFPVAQNAKDLEKKLKAKGYDTYITTNAANDAGKDEKPTPAPKPKPTIKVGSRVKVKQGAKSYNGTGLASFVYKTTYRVDALKGNRALLDSKGINTPVHIKDLILQ